MVLVAEDDPNALSGYLEYLTAAGFAASGRSDGAAALATAHELLPHIVFTVIDMPVLDGCTLALRLRGDARTRHVPLGGMTAYWTAEMQNDAHRAGFGAMLLKPCLPAHLLAEVFFFQAEDGIRDGTVTGVQTCALPISFGAEQRTAGTERAQAGAQRAQLAQHGRSVQIRAGLDRDHQQSFAHSAARRATQMPRSEERRVGKECRSRRLPYH